MRGITHATLRLDRGTLHFESRRYSVHRKSRHGVSLGEKFAGIHSRYCSAARIRFSKDSIKPEEHRWGKKLLLKRSE